MRALLTSLLQAIAPALSLQPPAEKRPPTPEPEPEPVDYQARLAQETGRFAEEIDVNALPEIFHYWSNRYIRPLLESFGYSHPEDFYARTILQHASRSTAPMRILSIGAGNCDAEVRVASALRAAGLTRFTLECLDLTEAMLERGRQMAVDHGVQAHFVYTCADFNRWVPAHGYDVVIANQSLHHVVALEHLFDAISEAIGQHGIFASSDMIGRNGHQRWPEALAILQTFWAELPDRYRYNVQLRRWETEFMDWDCASEGFEGIRAQDILPLLIERFGFQLFIAFGNVITPLVDRSFGHHFDASAAWDRDFIDRVHARDQAEIEAGRISPTHMLAVMSNDRRAQPRVYQHLTPQFCLRRG